MSTLSPLLYALHSFAGIVYEVVWIKLLTTSIGMTVTAVGVVSTTFMAGVGIGSYAIMACHDENADNLLNRTPGM